MMMNMINNVKMKNIMYVAAFMAVAGMAQASEEEDQPAPTAKKEGFFKRAQNKVSGLAEQARAKIGRGEKKANEKIGEGEEKVNKTKGTVRATTNKAGRRVAETAICTQVQALELKQAMTKAAKEQAESLRKSLDSKIDSLESELEKTQEKLDEAGNACGLMKATRNADLDPSGGAD